MHKNLEVRDVTRLASTKKFNRCRSFHFRYMELCRAKNMTPLVDIRSKNNATSMLDFYGDKLAVNDWLCIVEALFYDQVLQSLGIRLRKGLSIVLDHLDTEKKAKLYRAKPVICTKFIFSGVIEAVSNCIEFNKNLKVLNLEGLPLNDKYVESIAKALSSNESIKEISFQRSNIFDKGCEAICNTIKYLENVEKLNLSECELTTKGAECVADMIKIQKISRYTEGWQKSLRYRDVDPDTIPGLRSIALARNPQIGDDGIKPIVEVLKEDVWVKVVDMENCGLTDRAANLLLDCLEINNYIIDFNVRGNAGISKFLQRSIREHLGKEDEDQQLLEGQLGQANGANGGHCLAKKPKVTVLQLKEQLKSLEEQLAFERVLRKKAEQLNEKLNQQIIAYENQLQNQANARIPEGYVVVKNESLQSIIRERNDFHKIAVGVCSNSNSPRNIAMSSNNSRMKQQNRQQPQHPVTPLGSAALLVKEHPRKASKVRKVKSETKYVEPTAAKDTSMKKESKSDHEFRNEADYKLTSSVQFDTNIGDSVANNSTSARHSQSSDIATTRIEKKPNCNSNRNMKLYEIDELSLSTTRSITSDGASSDSDTLRNTVDDYQPMKVFIRRTKKVATPEHGQSGGGVKSKSPRSLFLGLC